MSSRAARLLLLVLAFEQGILGVWALLAPHSFWRGFPGGGRGWVQKAGPYDAHLIVDVGALSLALVVVLAGAAWLAEPRILALAATAWLAWSVPHLIFHLGHDHVLGTADRIGSDGGQAVTVLVGLYVLLTSIKELRNPWPASPRSPRSPAASSPVR